MKELDDSARPRSTSSPLAETAPPVHLRLMTLSLMVKMMVKNLINRRLEDRAVLRKESLLVRDIPLPKLLVEAGCGEMILREKSE